MKYLLIKLHIAFFLLLGIVSCKIKDKNISPEDIQAVNLKKGEPVLCGPPEQHFGTVAFETSCLAEVKKDFNLAVALLHSFEYDEAEKVFARIIDSAPACAMTYWGVAMCSYHPLWTAPGQAELIKGAKAIDIAESL
ncbi:MAG TPA: hypothetical protein VK543_00505, partial [Puia sp.]|nr:hypothetical protein [Puia sp.]